MWSFVGVTVSALTSRLGLSASVSTAQRGRFYSKISSEHERVPSQLPHLMVAQGCSLSTLISSALWSTSGSREDKLHWDRDLPRSPSFTQLFCRGAGGLFGKTWHHNFCFLCELLTAKWKINMRISSSNQSSIKIGYFCTETWWRGKRRPKNTALVWKVEITIWLIPTHLWQALFNCAAWQWDAQIIRIRFVCLLVDQSKDTVALGMKKPAHGT